MARETKDKMIGDLKITVTQFGAREAIRIYYKIMGIIAPLVASGVGSIQGKPGSSGDLMDFSVTGINGDTIGNAVRNIFVNLPEDQFLKLIDELMKRTRINGKAIIDMNEIEYDDILAGHITKIPNILIFIWEVNYGPLAIGNIGDLFQRLSNISRSQNASQE